ncbi:MAG: Aspartate carbamoyltransferase regulatory chain [uncultured bacterium]|nr:MAG: Aspartate carbamoyltransferase regulatory chain [uncultured bacterium]
MKNDKQIRAFKVFAIKEGTVIDHIPAGQALKIIRILKLQNNEKIVTMGMNFPSKTLKKKDIIKIEERELTPEEANKVAILAPMATINIIRNFELAKKFKVEMPAQVEKIIVCPNPKCITNNEEMRTIFYTQENNNEVTLQCRYCEKSFLQEEIIEYQV